jgi:hypothetical protein
LSLSFEGECESPAQSFTISNTGGSEFTWWATVDGVPVLPNPLFSMLLPGDSVEVAISPLTPLSRGTFNGTITIDTDSPAIGALGPIQVFYDMSGYFVTPPADIDFGEVPLGSEKSISFPASFNVPGVLLGSSNWDFVLTGNAPADPMPGWWTLIFTPVVLGPQSTTLTLGSFAGIVCPPNTFTGKGVGVAP